ncbi:hypothetical protein ACROYT_G014497 [Oculina patagonica]
MFLKPAQLAKGEQILRIVDFIDKIVSTVEDRTLSEISATKLVVSYGPKKPKLESVCSSVQQQVQCTVARRYKTKEEAQIGLGVTIDTPRQAIDVMHQIMEWTERETRAYILENLSKKVPQQTAVIGNCEELPVTCR